MLTFSEPIVVPGATLQRGTYEFKLMNASSSRNVVQITRENGSVVTSAQAIPIKRAEATNDTVLRFSPTDTGAPPAIKAWFYPGSLYGHEFVYPAEQARQIAERSKTVVLAIDVPGEDLRKGTLETIGPSGQRTIWRGDEATMREWDRWQRTRAARSTGDEAGEVRQAGAPLVRGEFHGTRIQLDELEDNPQKYEGKTVSVDGEVEEVLGPRLFTIDERRWVDLEGEILVLVKAPLAAFVREDDRITVTGTVKTFDRSQVEKEWGWRKLEADDELEFSRKPVLVAERIAGGNDNVAMIVEPGKDTHDATPVGTTGRDAAPLTSLAAVARADSELVGRRVHLKQVAVSAMAKGGGFFVSGNGESIFVLPGDRMTLRTGDTTSIEGRLMQMPDGIEDHLNATEDLNDDVYVYATRLSK
jgi:hypothetical protein